MVFLIFFYTILLLVRTIIPKKDKMEENEFEYFLSNRVFNYKLEKKYFGKVHKSMRQTTSNIFDFAKKISRPSAHSWCGGEFKGSVDKKNWVQSSILGLDFDKGGITIEEVYEKFKEFGIVPTLHYDTFSTSLQLRKFRVVLFLDHPINDQKVFTKIMGNLEKIFPIDIAHNIFDGFIINIKIPTFFCFHASISVETMKYKIYEKAVYTIPFIFAGFLSYPDPKD